jgi:hypothetical protein
MTDIPNAKSSSRLPLFGLVCCSLIFVFSSLAGIYIFLTPAAPVATLVIEPEVFDFGIVTEGQHLASFTLKNTSKQPISILYTVGGCSCTTISLRETLIPPQKTVVMKCTLDTTGMSDTFRGSILIGYVFGDISSINEKTTVEPFHAIVNLQAAVISGTTSTSL